MLHRGPSWKPKEADKLVRPTKMPFREAISRIALGRSHMLAIPMGNSNRVLTLGDNSQGQTAAGTLGVAPGSAFGEPLSVRIQMSAAPAGTSNSGAAADAAQVAVVTLESPRAVTRGARSTSIAPAPPEVPVPSSGKGSAQSSPGGLRAAFMKMSSKNSLPRPMSASGTPTSESEAASPASAAAAAGAGVDRAGARGTRSFSLGGLSAPKIRSRAEREADRAGQQVMAAQAATVVMIKSCLAGPNWSVVVTSSGQVWCWGEFLLGGEGGPALQLGAPTMVQELADVMIADVAGSESCLFATVGLRNEEDLKFQSFNPPTIRAASLLQLVNWICTDRTKPDPLFVYTLILSYHCYTSATQLLDRVRARYELAVAEASVHAQTQLCNFVVRWLQQRGDDFANPALRATLTEFLEIVEQEPMLRVIQRLLDKPQGEALASALPAAEGAAPAGDLLDYTPNAVAEAMTIVEHELFAGVHLTEFVGQGWAKADKAARCPGLVKLTASFNRCSSWVAGHIMNVHSREARSKRFAFWVEVHKQLFNLNNLSLAVALGAAFEMTPVFKLRNRNLIEVKSSAKKWLSYFAELQARNKAGYRKLLRKIVADGDPGIPYIGNHLSDLTFIEDGNPNTVDGDLVNMRKYFMLAKAVRTLDQLQKRRYTSLTPPPALLLLAASMKHLATDVLDSMEKIITAREGGAATGGPSSPAASSGTPNSAASPDSPLSSSQTTISRIAIAPSSLRNSGAEEPSSAPEILALLDKESLFTSAGADRVQRWAKWRERLGRQGDTFLAVWVRSAAWKASVVSVLQNPLSPEEQRHFRELCADFLLAVCQPELVADLLVSVSGAEPDEQLIVCLCNLTDALKRLPPPRAGEGARRAAAAEALEALAAPQELLVELEAPVPAREAELAKLMLERDSVVVKAREEEREAAERLDAQQAELARLRGEEAALEEQLARVRRQREELEDTVDRRSAYAGVQANNMARKLEILDTSIVDTVQSVDFLRACGQSFSNYFERVLPAVRAHWEAMADDE